MRKILYGVQGTGNGHISRACAMAQAMARHPELHSTWLLSGRERAAGCGTISDFEWREGLTFVTDSGKVKIWQTLKKNDLRRFKKDVRELKLEDYDLLISDFEPVLAHAAAAQNRKLIGIGHQYAFDFAIPMAGANPVSRYIMRHYAPVTTAVGLHWHHFGHPILPPIVDLDLPASLPPVRENKVLVYLPFENIDAIEACLTGLGEFHFHVYHPHVEDTDAGNLHLRAISRTRFKQDLLDAGRVITNSGFELISECLQLGKAIFSKPLQGQMEQLSNARALSELGYADIFQRMVPAEFQRWLTSPARISRVVYPDVAAALAQWIATGCRESVEELAHELWQQQARNPVNNLTLAGETA